MGTTLEKCGECVVEKPTALTYAGCETCGHWRKLDDRKIVVGGKEYTELEYAGKRKRG